jgi:8-hydroxy-5-deazaflavin:NADPH oxidoreductase
MIRTLPEGESSGSVVAGLLPAGTHYVKAFGTVGADQLATGANHEPRIVLFYATDDDAAEATAQRLIRAAGFEPLKVGGVSDAGRIEGPDGELQGRILDLDEARATVAKEGVKA